MMINVGGSVSFLGLGAGEGPGAVADGSARAGPPPAGPPEDRRRPAAPQRSETTDQGSECTQRVYVSVSPLTGRCLHTRALRH